MATAALIPLSEYLSSAYEPDCDYVDGELQERNVGGRPHSFVQSILVALFNANRRAWGVVAGTELRVHTAPSRYRVPDITVLRRSDPADPIVQAPPLICIEILSPEDRISRMQERFTDYFRMGVEHVWMIDPIARNAWIATPDGSHQHISSSFTVPGTAIQVSLAEIWSELDDMQTQG